jgi:hypothetical protein
VGVIFRGFISKKKSNEREIMKPNTKAIALEKKQSIKVFKKDDQKLFSLH